MTDRADAIVVGGGVLGCSAALHLKEAGVSDVLLLERDDLAQATSSAGAGFIGQWAAGYLTPWGDEELVLERYALAFYAGLAEEGHEFGYKRNGNLWVATSEQAWDDHVKVIAEHPAVEDRQRLSPDEVEEVTTIIPARAVYGGVLHPSGGQVSAGQATRAIARRFASRGGRVATRRPVERLIVDGGRVAGVETPQGRVLGDTVILAAGPWTNALLEPLGVHIAMVPLVAARITTEPLGVPPTMPTLMLQEFSFIWLREERGGLLWGCSFEVEPRYALVDRERPDRLEELPFDGILETQRVGVEASRAIPALTRYRSFAVAHGAPSYTPDLKAMVGPVARVDGLLVVGGCNEAGITHGPGYGKLIAELVVDGKASLTDVAAFDPGRFDDRYASDADVVAGMQGVMGSIFQAA